MAQNNDENKPKRWIVLKKAIKESHFTTNILPQFIIENDNVIARDQFGEWTATVSSGTNCTVSNLVGIFDYNTETNASFKSGGWAQANACVEVNLPHGVSIKPEKLSIILAGTYYSKATIQAYNSDTSTWESISSQIGFPYYAGGPKTPVTTEIIVDSDKVKYYTKFRIYYVDTYTGSGGTRYIHDFKITQGTIKNGGK